MVQVVWTESASADLKQVHDFIARDSARYARATVEKITSAAKRLGRFPQLGAVVPELSGLVYRQIIVGNYRIIYRVSKDESQVFIMGVIHASRSLPLFPLSE